VKSQSHDDQNSTKLVRKYESNQGESPLRMEPQAILEFTPLPAKKLLDKMAYFEDTPDTSNEA
jgi:hypothetical protein